MTRASDFVSQACQQTGLDDFGSDSFLEGLDVYCDSVFDEAALNEIGMAAISSNIVSCLVNRLRVVDWAAQHPELAEEKIQGPLFVIGMFRAGTTLLIDLLDQDPANRCLLRWESADSVPPPTARTFRSGPRVDAARAGLEMLEMLNPKMKAVHHEDADGPTECISVMSQDFKSLSWEAISNVPSYGRWLQRTDQRSAYEYHHLVLQLLQSGGVNGRWTLKSPHHAMALDALVKVYPDARLVLIHRDPSLLCASVCSLIKTLSSTFTDHDHTGYIAEHWTHMLDLSISRIEEFRTSHPEQVMIDVRYDDLVKDPVGPVAAIYQSTGSTLQPEARTAMTEYLATHPKGALGEHRYDLDEFGLNAGQLRERFSAYAEKYGV
jgi:hypothetical protein